jgi:hypothetical protein
MMFMVYKQAMAGEFKAGDVSYFVYSLGAISELLGELGIFIGRQQQLRVSIQRLETIGHNLPAERLCDKKPSIGTPAHAVCADQRCGRNARFQRPILGTSG